VPDAPLLAVRLLEPGDDTEKFHCGEDSLDDYLHRYALSAQRSGGPRTHVALADDGSIVGYYSLVNGSIERETAPVRLAAGMGRYAIPVTVIARLAVAGGGQRQGVGTDLVLHAFKTATSAADIVGSRAITVDALRQGLQGWYARFGFREFDPGKEPPDLHMYVLMKDVRETITRFG
jgi:GNAT superfamily N-acetyltransferase